MKIKPSKKEVKIGIKIITTAITIVSALFIIYTVVNYEALQQNFSTQIQNYGLYSLFGLSLALDLIPQLISPIMILAAAILAGINIHYAVAATALGSALGSFLGFEIGRKHIYQAVRLTASPESIKTLTHLTNKYGKIVIPLSAISPLPYLPVLLGTMNLSKKNFVLYGLIPRTLSFIIFGYLVKTI